MIGDLQGYCFGFSSRIFYGVYGRWHSQRLQAFKRVLWKAKSSDLQGYCLLQNSLKEYCGLTACQKTQKVIKTVQQLSELAIKQLSVEDYLSVIERQYNIYSFFPCFLQYKRSGQRHISVRLIRFLCDQVP